MKAAFSGALGEEMKSKAQTWASETPNIKSLPRYAHGDKTSGAPSPQKKRARYKE